MKWTLPFPMFAADQLVPLAIAAEEAGFDSITVPDSVFYPEQVSAKYPYSPDGERFWPADTPFVDPFVAIPAMAAVTERVRFYTNVLKLPLRNPLLVAKQVSSIAVLSGNRFSLGVGLSWIPEEFTWTGTEKRTRGARTDEAIEIVKLVCAGRGPEFVEYHGKHYDFGRLMISPAPTEPVPILVGGHSEPAFDRAARVGDGWVSVQTTEAQVIEAIGELRTRLENYGRAGVPFEIKVLCLDVFDLDGFRRLADHGVTELQVVPWYFYGGDPESLDTRREAFFRFADDVIAKF
ncbi:MAG: TIGR03619 family F420-dependent LLM class oxidoreductase [Acidimicrobiia bacterium]